MSRAFQIRVKESLTKVLHAEDHVSTQLEMLGVLPCDQMSELLAGELEKLGFDRDGNTMSQDRNGVTVVVDSETAVVTVRNQTDEKVSVTQEKTARAYDDVGDNAKSIRKGLEKEVASDLEKKAEAKRQELQSKVTDALEAELADIRRELDKAVNRATAEALKQKAGQMGQIKEMTEDPETGSLTIVVDV